MLKWSELKRASDIVLAVWPHYRPLFERWMMQELIDKGELAPIWRERMVPGNSDSVLSDHYHDREAAIAAANALNPILQKALAARVIDPVAKRSLVLKVDKALQAKQRLQDEEALMLAEALRRHADDERPDVAALKLASDSERYRQDLAEQLAKMPYLKVAKVGRSGNRWRYVLLYLGPDGVWSKPYPAGEKAAQTAERAKIANGFSLSASSHWGKTKAKIRQILLPRANQLLQLASVQRMLAEALGRGVKIGASLLLCIWVFVDRNPASEGKNRQIDALTSPDFLDLSARSAKLGFVEPSGDPDSADTGGYYGYLSTPRLQFWSIDEKNELATSISALEWIIQAGLAPESKYSDS